MLRIIALLTLVGLVAGCNTVDGFGQDLSAGARAIDRAI
ncbi:MAG: ECN family pore-forming entericidin [Pseudomonadota bacterium]